jgi:flagellar biosynthesis/type III secretory pathway protein FliH
MSKAPTNLHSILDEAYSEGYSDGEKSGINKGYKRGYSDGQKDTVNKLQPSVSNDLRNGSSEGGKAMNYIKFLKNK